MSEANGQNGQANGGANGQSRLRLLYVSEVRPRLMEQFGYTNIMQAPKLDKIVLNMGVGEGVADNKKIDAAVLDMTLIAGQKPIVTKARKSVAAFKVRTGMQVGCMTTLRRERMYEFLDRLVTIALPRVAIFAGFRVARSTAGATTRWALRSRSSFPRSTTQGRSGAGMNVVICTTARTDDEGRALLAGFQMPFVGQ